ncbi:MAG TPA: DUF4258 domain-containing protein [Chitinophagaceae bacterium]|nr:DUF4258 domain-containing protein [Chitinophagaceae bacterium]
MNKKWYPFILIAILLAALIVVKLVGKKSSTDTTRPKTTTTTKDPASTVSRDRGFDRRVSYLEYSDHAKCRMQCRKISQKEVEEIMKDGKINYNKSDIQNARCPRYAVEGVTSDNQRVRIVYAQCNEKTVVVTVIDLETDYECHCPGDDDKYENQR